MEFVRVEIRYFLLILLLLSPSVAFAQAEFDGWLADLRREAAVRGISPETLQAALDELEPIPRVIELDRQQPEFTLTFSEYLQAMLSERRIGTARERMRQFRPQLTEIGRRYGVAPSYLVALWGIESFFGTATGGFPVVGALATLAWEGRRSAFFRNELLVALQILDQGHITPAGMMGSWAGAMGQFQFMPSTFHRFAVDYDEDGRKDIWDTPVDAFASAANYLQQAGWRKGIGWGQRVRLPRGFNRRLAGLETRKSLRQWRRLGVQGVGGPDDRQASLLLPEGSGGPAFLVTDNFRVLLNWNRSVSFAVAVGELADRL